MGNAMDNMDVGPFNILLLPVHMMCKEWKLTLAFIIIMGIFFMICEEKKSPLLRGPYTNFTPIRPL